MSEHEFTDREVNGSRETSHAQQREEAQRVRYEEEGEAPRRRLDSRTIAIVGLFVLAVCYTLYAARAFLLPLVMAVMLAMMLRPVMLVLERRLRLPPAVGAAGVLLFFAAAVFLGMSRLLPPALEWMETIPDAMREAEWKLRSLRKPVDQVAQATEQIEKLTEMAGGDAPAVRVEQGGLASILINSSRQAVASLVVIVPLLYFLLASGDLFLRRLVQATPRFRDKVRTIEIAQHLQEEISRYILTISVINGLLGVAVGTVFWALGMPNPILWGVMAAAFNYVPFLGAMVGLVIVSLVALISYDSLGDVGMVAGSYLALTVIESNLITPFVLGRRMMINPVVVFVGILFWGWMWGVVGALLAAPLLVAIKIVCDSIQGLRPIGGFLAAGREIRA